MVYFQKVNIHHLDIKEDVMKLPAGVVPRSHGGKTCDRRSQTHDSISDHPEVGLEGFRGNGL